MTTHTTSWPNLGADAATAPRAPSVHSQRLPREVLPLLATIGATELTMAGIILWFSAPTVAPTAITGLGVGATSIFALAMLLRFIDRATRPAPTRHIHPQRM